MKAVVVYSYGLRLRLHLGLFPNNVWANRSRSMSLFSTCRTLFSNKRLYLKDRSYRSLSGFPPKNQASDLKLSEDAAPQGIQGGYDKDCHTFSLWLDNCRRYGLANCDEQLQGIQSGRKTLSEVLEEQEKLIAEIASQYKVNIGNQQPEMQGVQDDVVLFPDVNIPCPQGVQGEDCETFKVWLENCHRFGFANCMQQLKGFRNGRKTLAEIFEEQNNAIQQAAYQYQQKRFYSTPSSQQVVEEADVNSKTQEAHVTQPSSAASTEKETNLTARQKLQRAVKEYGSTVMIFHISISLASLGFFYTLVNSGIDVVGLLSQVGVGGESVQAKIAGGTGTFVVAYAVHKLFAPVRIAATLTATPLIVRYLRRVGFLKAPRNV